MAAAAALAGAGDDLLADALTRAAAHGRLAQELAGAPELLRRYEHGAPRTRALLKAAMDARRVGVGLHQPQDFLVTAATGYLDDHEWEELPDDWGEAALADTTRRVHGRLAPLRRIDPQRARRPLGWPVPGARAGLPGTAGTAPWFRLADCLEQHGRAVRWRLCPPASFWWAYSHLDGPDDLDRLAEAAENRYRLDWASQLRERAARLRRGETPTAARDGQEGGAPKQAGRMAPPDADDEALLPALARLQAQTASWKGAEILCRQAVDAGYSASVTELARLREQHGDLRGAEALVRRAADAAHGTVVAKLARLGEQGGDAKDSQAPLPTGRRGRLRRRPNRTGVGGQTGPHLVRRVRTTGRRRWLPRRADQDGTAEGTARGHGRRAKPLQGGRRHRRHRRPGRTRPPEEAGRDPDGRGRPHPVGDDGTHSGASAGPGRLSGRHSLTPGPPPAARLPKLGALCPGSPRDRYYLPCARASRAPKGSGQQRAGLGLRDRHADRPLHAGGRTTSPAAYWLGAVSLSSRGRSGSVQSTLRTAL